MSSFKSFALDKKMLDAIEKIGYQEPSKVQELVIPRILRGESIVVSSETGSGKTHAFLIPIMQKIDASVEDIQAIIVAPTRELAYQTYEFARELGKYYTKIRIQLLTSQIDKSRSSDKLNSNPHLLIATPGRLLDMCVKNSEIKIATSKFIVIDEADMLMDMGFLEDIDTLLKSTPYASKMVFSATINDKLARVIEKYISADKIVKLDNLTNNHVKHYAIDIRHQDRNGAIKEFINIYQPFFLLIFASKKEDVNNIYNFLKENGFNVGIVHGDLEKRERKNVMRRIKMLEFQIVVCSDMVARGLDIDDVSDVLNVDLPRDLSFYYHRAGRTGRFNKDGKCFTFYNDDNVDAIKKLQSEGVDFTYKILKKNQLIDGKAINLKKEFRHKTNDELERDIKRAIRETKKSKVKPGYKKAVKNAIANVKKKHHRKMVKDQIRKQRVERYKEEARKNG